MTRFWLLQQEATDLARTFTHVTVGAGLSSSAFFSTWPTSPSGKVADDPDHRWHFLAVPCRSSDAIGRMVACVSTLDPDELIHHEERACPHRTYPSRMTR